MDKKPYVLFVEDNPQDAILFERVCKQGIEGYDFVFVPDVDPAIELLTAKLSERHLPELVFLDLKLVKGTGFGVLGFIKNHELLSSLPVIVMSSSDRHYDIEMASILGSDDYVVKPKDYQVLKKSLPEIILNRVNVYS